MTAFDEFPASAQQRAMWFVESLAPGTSRYHVPAAIDLDGDLDSERLRDALDAVVARHEALRTGFAADGGELRQRVYPRVPVVLDTRDAVSEAHADEIERETALTPFDLAAAPLLRACLIRLTPRRHRLLLVAHHLICDAWSSGILIRDLARAAAGEPLAAPAIQYADYAVWQDASQNPQATRDALDAWRARLLPPPEPLAVPFDRIRPRLRGDTGAATAGTLPLGTGFASPFGVLLTGLAVALHRLTGQDDLVIGAVAAQRDRPELAEVVGCLVNTVPIRISLAGDPTIGTVLDRCREALTDALTRVDLPFDRLVEALRPPRDPGRLPLCDVLATWTPPGPQTVDLAGATGTVRRLPTLAAKADLTVEAAGERLHVEYDRAVLADETVSRLVEIVSRVAVADPGTPITRLPLTDQSDVELQLRGPAVTAPDATVVQRFAETVARHGDRVAVDAPDGKRTYAELAEDVRRCAAGLVEAGVRAGDRVGVRTGRSVAWPIAMLAAMTAGAAVVPLDPEYPARRSQDMLDDAGVTVVVTDLLDGGPAEMASPGPRDLAYVIYTSGSTGRPKGVAVEHASLVRLADAAIDRFRLGPGDRILRFSSPAFDAAMWDLVLALLSGATLCLAETPRLAPGPILRDTLRDLEITYVLVPPSALLLVPHDEPLPRLRLLVSGGEACPAELVNRWRAGRRFVNAYGPTEATVCATWWEPSTLDTPEPPPLGEPLPGVNLHLLDSAGRPVPDGFPGEIHIGGANLARGYWGRDDLTEQLFIHDPTGERLYRTGDRAVRRADGSLIFCGRGDDQVKIRGFRVEPAEAERFLQGQPGVRAAVVVPRRTGHGVELVGYYVGADTDPAVLMAAVRAQLPAYLTPAHLVRLDALPLTPNGKLDRAALPAPAVRARSRPPRPGIETQVAMVWCEVLEVETIGAEDNFFDVGGHSLALAQVHARLTALTGRDLALVELFTHPTVAAMAAHLALPDAAAASQTGRDRAELRRAAQDRMRRRPA